MNIAVMGAGAVGCYYGAMLARAGHRVVLIGRPALVAAVTAHGLLLESTPFTGRVDVQADTSPAALQDAELVLFCVKSGDTERAGADMAPYLSPRASVLSMQNGVDNAARLSTVLGRHTIPVVVYVATEIVGPGHVRHHGRGDLMIGPSETSDAIASIMTAAGLPAEVCDDVIDALWTKLIINCAYNGLSAVSQLPYGELVRQSHVLDTMHTIVDECVAVARADGMTVPDGLWERVVDISVNMAGQRSSSAQDLARGRQSEIEHLNGYVVRRGRELGVSTPANLAVLCAVTLLEARTTL
ncbi:MAG TPA: 2-dehydropantoate 2-reductase [Vicinamibacterales bacterium]|nr:2-dehydropantoate 2-reductase [Vicinamibacterales bacterium]